MMTSLLSQQRNQDRLAYTPEVAYAVMRFAARTGQVEQIDGLIQGYLKNTHSMYAPFTWRRLRTFGWAIIARRSNSSEQAEGCGRDRPPDDRTHCS